MPPPPHHPPPPQTRCSPSPQSPDFPPPPSCCCCIYLFIFNPAAQPERRKKSPRKRIKGLRGGERFIKQRPGPATPAIVFLYARRAPGPHPNPSFPPLPQHSLLLHQLPLILLILLPGHALSLCWGLLTLALLFASQATRQVFQLPPNHALHHERHGCGVRGAGKCGYRGEMGCSENGGNEGVGVYGGVGCPRNWRRGKRRCSEHWSDAGIEGSGEMGCSGNWKLWVMGRWDAQGTRRCRYQR